MELKVLKIERDPPIGRIVINRPEKRNAILRSTVHEFPAAIEELGQDGDIRVIIMKGAGGTWSTGFDTTAAVPDETSPQPSPTRGLPSTGSGQALERGPAEAGHSDAASEMLQGRAWLEGLFKVWDCPKPVIAQLQGDAGGWSSLPIAFCDLRYASPDFRLKYAAGRTGSMLGGVWALFVGLAPAKEWYWRPSYHFSADDLLRHGVLNRIYPADRLEQEVEAIAREAAAVDPLFLRLQKLGLNRLWDREGFREKLLTAKDMDVLLHSSLPGRANFQRLRELGGDRQKMAVEQARGAAYWEEIRKPNPRPLP